MAAARPAPRGTVKVVNNGCEEVGRRHCRATWTSTKKTFDREVHLRRGDTGTKNTCAAKSGYTKVAMAVEKGTVTGGSATGLVGGAVNGTVCAYSKSGIHIFNKGPFKQ